MLLQCKVCAERFSKFHSPLRYSDCGDCFFYKPPGGDLPASRSPRVRRRYKVQTSASRSHYAEEEEEEEEDDKSTGDSDIR